LGWGRKDRVDRESPAAQQWQWDLLAGVVDHEGAWAGNTNGLAVRVDDPEFGASGGEAELFVGVHGAGGVDGAKNFDDEVWSTAEVDFIEISALLRNEPNVGGAGVLFLPRAKGHLRAEPSSVG
jgi:hypothetical protein